MPRLSSEDIGWRAIWMKEMLGYQMDEKAASLKMSLSFDPTTLIEIAVYIHKNYRNGYLKYTFELNMNSPQISYTNCG